ncbi:MULTISPECIES: GntR family transcriptional regulator [Mameliella]|uniref:GntR family transcriptional regulator n=1 Tax=Mameliella alba TaxID=561184 RepID=A0A0B3RTP0_9RHOB|nr:MULTISPECIES: GntR family transcriptional regulator [Mameliella]KHQ50138.1 GntR family transcriptional regulator [Mameliella alba]
MAKNDEFNREPLAAQVHNALREEIISGQLEGNQRIDASHYAKSWSISTTPIRDAFKQLEMEGLLRVSPRRGVFVKEVNWKELKEIYEVRMAIECTAIRLATPNIPSERSQAALKAYHAAQSADSDTRATLLREADFHVHELAMEFCGNERLQRMAEGIHDLVRWSRQTLIRKLPRPYEDTLKEHIEICEAVCDGDSERAASSMRRHLENTLERIRDFLGVQVANDDLEEECQP